MLLEYDPAADAVYVALAQPLSLVSSDRIDESRTLCYDEHDALVGIEFLFVSKGINLEGMPEAERIAGALGSFPRTAA